MKIYVHQWFDDTSLTVLYKLLSDVFNEKVETGTIENSDILLETVFASDTLLYRKKWAFSFLFIGESDRRLGIFMRHRMPNIKDYSCVLKGQKDNNNIVNFPLFVLYSYNFQFTHSFLKTYYEREANQHIEIPPKGVCVIVSNMDSEGRHLFFQKLEQHIKIDYAGNYRNNVPKIEHTHSSPEFIQYVSQYKIIITMENSKNNDYITEKILHGFAAKTIPVYWGSDNIHEYFNKERFINVPSFEERDINEAIEQIKLLLSDDEKYLNMVNQPIYTNNTIPFTLQNISQSIKKLLKIEKKQKAKFITFGSPTYYHGVKRICEEAKQLEFFDEIQGFTDVDLKKDVFWEKHGNFIENNKKGYGYWIWKSYLIKKTLDELNENDILVYCDAGCEINKNGKNRLLEYVNMLLSNKQNYGLISFQLTYSEIMYTKNAIFDHFECDKKSKQMLQCVATVQIIKKNDHSINLVNKWYESCCHKHLINDEIRQEHPSFIENRHDQSILSVLVNKYGSIKLFDETYCSNWENAKDFPFLAKRHRG